MQPRTLALILARKDSKRLKRKHLIQTGGKPVIEYTFEYAKSPLVTDIACSTDCKEIGALATAAGISFIERPPELAGDTAHIIDAIEHALYEYEKRNKFLPAITVTLCGNVPYRRSRLDDGLRLFHATGADSVVTACRVAKYHPDWMFNAGDENEVVFYRDTLSYRCQDLKPCFIETGAFIISKTEALLRRKPMSSLYSDFGDRIHFLEERMGDTIEIDELEDLEYFNYLISRNGGSADGSDR